MNNYGELLKDPRWQKKRLEIMDRDKFTCQVCKETKLTLNVHHLAYSGDPWDVDSDLLITLCENCHKTEENMVHRLSPAYKSINELGILTTDVAELILAMISYVDHNQDGTAREKILRLTKLINDMK